MARADYNNDRVRIQDEGILQGLVNTINFVGGTVVATVSNNVATITVTAGIIGGGGTLNYIPKWTPDGVTLGNSIIFENTGKIGISTITPAYKFTVVTAADTTGIAQTDGSIIIGTQVSTGGGGYGILGTLSASHFALSSNNVAALVINSVTQNVAIANDAALATYKFTVVTAIANYGFAHVAGAITLASYIGGGISILGTLSPNAFNLQTNSTSVIFMQGDQVIGIGRGFTAPTAALHLQSIGATNATYAYKIDNSATAQIAYFRDDKQVTFGSLFRWTPSIGLLVNANVSVGVTATDDPTVTFNIQREDYLESCMGTHSNTITSFTDTNLNYAYGSNTGVGVAFVNTDNASIVVGTKTNSTVNTRIATGLAIGSKSWIGFYSEIASISGGAGTGTIADCISYYASVPQLAGNVPVASYGMYFENQGHAGITNTYAVYIAAQSGSTNNYGLVSLSNKNGIFTATPTAYLHLGAGTATASTAPLKFTAGTLNTTPEIGAMEFTDDGTTAHLYVTVRVATVVTRVQIV